MFQLQTHSILCDVCEIQNACLASLSCLLIEAIYSLKSYRIASFVAAVLWCNGKHPGL